METEHDTLWEEEYSEMEYHAAEPTQANEAGDY